MSTNPKKRGRTVFQFRFTANSNCGITSGCPYLPGAMPGQMQQQLPAPGSTFFPQPQGPTLMLPQM
jgi:hypothetical protein